MKICHICPSFNNNIYSQLIERQMKINKKIRVFYFRVKERRNSRKCKDYVDEVQPYSNFDRLFFYSKEKKILKSFWNLYGQEEFDFIHAHTLFSAGYVALAAKKKWGIPYVVAVRGTDVNVFFKYRVHLRKIGLEIMEEAAAIVFISHAHKEEVLEKYVPEKLTQTIAKKTYVLPNGIDEFWHKNKRVSEKKDDIISLIYYGDINANKNLRVTIQAIELLMQEGYQVHFYVIGKVFDKKYSELIRHKDYITYYDFVPKETLIEYVRKAQVFVMPSKSETFGLAYAEAMSQGLPVIYSEGQGFDKQFAEGTVGYHVEVKSARAVAEAVKKILEDYANMSIRCVQNVERYSWDSIVAQYQELYEREIGEGSYGCVKDKK